MCFGCDGIAIYGTGALIMIVMKIPPLGRDIGWVVSLTRSSSYHQSRPHHLLLDLARRKKSFDVSHKYIDSFFSYHVSALFDGGKHRVACHGAFSVCESADADILWHFEPHSLGGI